MSRQTAARTEIPDRGRAETGSKRQPESREADIEAERRRPLAEVLGATAGKKRHRSDDISRVVTEADGQPAQLWADQIGLRNNDRQPGKTLVGTGQ
jgi:hypothetical protein